jgi:hypothetical protein
VDDYTRWRAILPLKTKDALVETFRSWHQQFVVRTVGANNVTKTIRCDIAAHVQFTNVYSCASNGVAERAIQDIMNGSTGLLIGSRFDDDKRPWLEFAMAFVYITNRLPTSADPKCTSPYQMLYDEVPDLSHFCTIGCKVHVLIPKERRRAFDSKTRVGMLVGYASGTNGYRVLLDPKTGETIESANVTIVEDVMYFGDASDAVDDEDPCCR